MFAFLDIHQHGKKKSVFIYGPHYPLHSSNYLGVRLLPKLLDELSPPFRFHSSRFRPPERYKSSCARLALHRLMPNVVNTFTVECSAYGWYNHERVTSQWTTE